MFADQVAVVTGSGAGIGAAIAKRLAAEGATVLGVDVAESVLPAALGDQHHFVRGDVSDPHTWDTVWHLIEQRCGRWDLLVSNAAVQLEKPLFETTVDEFDRTFAVNVRGCFLALRAASQHLARTGAIVTLGSVLGFTADPALGAYAASKGAVLNLTREAAIILGPSGIRVNCVCPAAVNTPLTTRVWDLTADPAAARTEMEQLYPRREIAEPEEIADIVVFLLGPGSRAMTGSLVVADGGLTATNAEYALTSRIDTSGFPRP